MLPEIDNLRLIEEKKTINMKLCFHYMLVYWFKKQCCYDHVFEFSLNRIMMFKWLIDMELCILDV